MKQISLDLVRVTEAAAIAASAWVGSGDKIEADRAATDAMRQRLDTMEFAGTVKIGEGIKDGSVGLFKGDQVGFWAYKQTSAFGPHSLVYPEYDIAVDPIDGTTPTVSSGPEAMSVIAVAGKDCMFETDEFYMHKMAVGPHIQAELKIEDDLAVNLQKIALATNKPLDKITVCILNRPRHDGFVAIMRTLGVRIKLIQDCDISGAIAACQPDSGIDMMYGIGGAPESVIAAAAIKCLGGDFQSQLADKEGNLQDRVYRIEDLVRGPCVFAATGITNGSLLQGVRVQPDPITNSVFMRSESGTIRWITTRHGN